MAGSLLRANRRRSATLLLLRMMGIPSCRLRWLSSGARSGSRGYVRAGDYHDVLRRPAFDNDAVGHEDHLIADITGEPELVGDDQHRHSGIGEASALLQYLADEFGIES